jgi:hypothetical protein
MSLPIRRAYRSGTAAFAQTPESVDELLFMHKLCGHNQAACNETLFAEANFAVNDGKFTKKAKRPDFSGLDYVP